MGLVGSWNSGNLAAHRSMQKLSWVLASGVFGFGI